MWAMRWCDDDEAGDRFTSQGCGERWEKAHRYGKEEGRGFVKRHAKCRIRMGARVG